MRPLILLLFCFTMLFGGMLQAQDACGPSDLNPQIDTLFATYIGARQEDALSAAEALQASLADVLAECAVEEAAEDSEPAATETLIPGQWRIEWASDEPIVCPNSEITYTSRDLAFLLQVDRENDRITAIDNYAWLPLVFEAETGNDYASVGSQTLNDISMNYNYQITIISPEQIEGTGSAYLPAVDCTLSDAFVMTLVDETIICMVNAPNGPNLRGGPGTTFDRTGTLPIVDLQPVYGQALDSSGMVWWQLGRERWVRSDLVSEAGSCDSLPVVAAE